jgi:hypothetical protein
VQDIASYHLPQPFLIRNVICLKLEHIETLDFSAFTAHKLGNRFMKLLPETQTGGPIQ